jgi:hypothetical protein
MILENQGVNRNPFGDNQPMNEYLVTLSDDNGGNVSFPFYTGLGWSQDPTLGDILDSIRSDLSIDVEDADDMGMTPSGWERVRAFQDQLRPFFGDALDTLLDEEDWSDVDGTEVTFL